MFALYFSGWCSTQIEGERIWNHLKNKQNPQNSSGYITLILLLIDKDIWQFQFISTSLKLQYHTQGEWILKVVNRLRGNFNWNLHPLWRRWTEDYYVQIFNRGCVNFNRNIIPSPSLQSGIVCSKPWNEVTGLCRKNLRSVCTKQVRPGGCFIKL